MKLSLKDYQGVHFSFNILALYLNRLLIQFGFGVVGIFQVIFLFEKFDSSVSAVALVYALMFILTLVFTPLSAMLIASIGMKRMMMFAMPFAFLIILSMLLWDHNPILALVGFVFSLVIYKALYWVPYHVDFAKFTDKKTRGRQMSVLLAVSAAIGVITPVVGGFVIMSVGFNSLFVISLGILIFAIAPLFFIDNKKERYSYGYFETFSELLHKKNRPLLLGYFGDGAQTGVTAIVWPIFIFLLLKGEFFVVGVVSSLTILLIMTIRFFVGDLLDRWNKKRVLAIGSILNTTGWIAKLFIETGFQVFAFDAYHKMGRAVNRISVDATTYDQAADNGHYVDEFTVLKEVSVSIGKVAMLTLIAAVVLFFDLKVNNNDKPIELTTINESSPNVHIITLSEDGFEPKDITINVGDTITFRNNLNKPFWPASNLHPSHAIYPEFDPLELIEPGREWSFQFMRLGSWNYHDHIRSYYRGTITVESEE